MCGKATEHTRDDVLPFCSRTCKLADLGRWLEGSYRIPGPPLEIENDGAGVVPASMSGDRSHPEES